MGPWTGQTTLIGSASILASACADVLLERPHDHLEVVLKRLVVVHDEIVEEPRIAVVRAQEVAREQHLVLFQIREHGIRPVKERRRDEPERPAAQIDPIALPHDHGLDIPVQDGPHEIPARLGHHHLRIGRDVEDVAQRAGMIRLQMVAHHVVDVLWDRWRGATCRETSRRTSPCSHRSAPPCPDPAPGTSCRWCRAAPA